MPKTVKKYQNGGKESEDNLPAEGTMMGDLLRMFEQFKEPKSRSEYGTYTTDNPYDDPAFMNFAEKYDLYDEDYKDKGQQYFDLLYNKLGRDRIVNILEEQIESNRPYYDLSALRGFSKSSPVPGPLPEYAEGQFTLARHFRDLIFRKDSDHPLRKEYERIQEENPDREWSQIQDELFKDYNPTSREIAEFIVDYRGSYMPTEITESGKPRGTLGEYNPYGDLIDIAKYNPDLLDTFIHELQHGSESADYSLANAYILSSKARNIMEEERQRLANDPENKNYDELYHEGPSRGYFTRLYNYYADPTETSARIQTLRRNLSQVGVNIFEEDVTLEDLEKLKRLGTEESLGVDMGSKSGSESLDQLRAVYTDEGIVRMLNNIFKKGGRIKTIKKYKKFSHGGIHTEDEPSDISSNNFSILQALTNLYNWRENLAENINPRSYDFYKDDDAPGRTNPIFGSEPLQRLYNAIILDRKEPKRQSEEDLIELDYNPEDIDYMSDVAVETERQDLLNLMLGLDQKYNSIEPAIYKPTRSKDADAKYYRSKVTEEQIRDKLKIFSNKINEGEYEGFDMTDLADLIMNMDAYGAVLGNYTLDQGVDEKGHYISYYDKWDVNPLSSGNRNYGDNLLSRGLEDAIQSAVGIEPAELYGRIYYNPETGQPIQENKYGGRIKTIKKSKPGMKIKKRANK